METVGIPSALPETGVRASRSAPIIIATDGRAQSDSALIVGRMLAESPAALRLVTVVRPMPMIAEAPAPVPPEIEAERQDSLRRDIVHQMVRTWDDEYDIELHQGDPATVISRLAHETGATMIVAGLGRHRVTDRVFGEETALRLVRMSDVPVFAATNGLARAARRIVVALDFSETSRRAARLALEVASSNATVYLAHVAPRDSVLEDWRGQGATYKSDAGAALQAMRDELRIPRGTMVQTILLQGDPATELLAFAASVNAELIATGSHGHGFVARLLIGSVATRIVRCSTCSVLTVPHAAAMTRARVTGQPSTVMALAHDEWVTQLEDFTRRNFGRRGSLEVDDPEIGAQAQESRYPLLGAAFDIHDQQVELMFGELGHGKPHLTRGIGGVSAIDVLRDDKGRDVAMRVAHGTGQTLLTFTS